MRFHKVPQEYFKILIYFFGTSLLTILLAFIKDDFKWWALNWLQFRVPFVASLVSTLFFAFLFLKFPQWGKRWLLSHSFCLILYFFIETVIKPTTSHIVLLILTVSYCFKIYQNILQYLKLPAIHLGLNWFQGPQAFSPHLESYFLKENFTLPFLTTSLSSNGLSGKSETFEILDPKNQNQIIQLKFKNSTVKVRTDLICSDQNINGSQSLIFGLKFNRLKPDEEKDLTDFLEIMRGEGYEC